MKRLLLAIALFPILVASTVYAQSCSNPVANPALFQWEDKGGYWFGVLEMGEATFAINGETLTTRAYRQGGETPGDYSIPGPTIVMAPGQKYVLRFENRLPYQPASEEHNVYKDPNVTNLHTHGLHISGESPGDDVTRVFEGGYYGDYVYDIPDNHMGGTFWYHAHHHGSTFLQVSSGAFGLIVIDDAQDGLPLNVTNMDEQHLVLGFLEPGNAEGTGGDTLISGTFSAGWTINGSVGGDVCLPADTWQHWRMLVADQDARLVDLEIGDGCEVGLMARDGVWRTQVPKILGDNKLTLTGASRADLAVRCSTNSTISVAGNQVSNISVSGSPNSDVHPYDENGEAAQQPWAAIRPDYLLDFRKDIFEVADSDSIRMGARSVLGRKFDATRANLTKDANGIQEWSLNGATNHPYHLHNYHVQVQSDCGPYEAGEFYDVIAGNCDLRFLMNDTEAYEGRTIFHCHILQHEDQGAMGWMDVVGGRPAPDWPVDENMVFSALDEIDGSNTTPPPAAPSELSATTVSTSGIDLAWLDNAGDETGFVIERSDSGGSYAQIAAAGEDTIAYSDAGLASNTTYSYRVAAVNGGGPSGYSNTASATTQAAGAGTYIKVGNITVSTVGVGKGNKSGRATIAVVDDAGNPVAGAMVTGDFSGDINEGAIEDQADEFGISVVQTSASTAIKKVRNLTFCVTAITDPSGTLDDFNPVAPGICSSL
jgi:FtsP/CotA-like multicopper oxidase with cupredoxin domain